MTRLDLLFAALTFLGTAHGSNPSAGAALVRHGDGAKVLPCAACHGLHLEGNPSIGAPALAGLPSRQTIAALDAIAAGRSGHSYVMQGIAHALSPAQRQAIAAYLAQLPTGRDPAS